jgi:non-lysosomal glucosylceramidase
MGSKKHRKLHAYTGKNLTEISFPLGGIGTGCIGLAGNGRLIDWEIFNRPNKGSINGFSHFAVRAESEGKVLDARILNGDLHPPYTGNGTGYGFGPSREYLAGLPHFRAVEFTGQYPFARLSFKENRFPGNIAMTAFNPFIPLNDKDSGIPAAIFDIEVKNTYSKPVLYTFLGTLTNTLPGISSNALVKKDGVTSLFLTADFFKPADTGFGDLCISTDAKDTSVQQYWYRGNWFDSLEIYWKDLNTPGKIKNRVYEKEQAGGYNHGTLAAHVLVKPGEKKNVRFVISWNFPNCQNYWDTTAAELAEKAGIPLTWKNYYASLWKDSRESGAYTLKNMDRLYAETLLFKNALFGSTLPEEALDAVSANLSVLKSPSVMRLEDGTFYGWEGCFSNSGCCEGSCTHVWNYAQALPFLFPGLERSMRDADYRYNQQENGGMPFRLKLPLGIKHPGGTRTAVGSDDQGGRSCADGLFGNVLKVYRDWKISGDTAWLIKIWPSVKKSIEFAWDPTNEDAWDPEKTGVLKGRQHHTLDMELFGPNSWLTGFYLAALKAGAEIAGHLGEGKTATKYMSLFKKGKAWADKHLFNGEYYCQLIDLKDKTIPERFKASAEYWDDEHSEIKYQIGPGCGIDQVLAQWHANIYGLGEIFDPSQTRKALFSLFKYNFKKSMRDFPNPCRVYCLNDEKGLVVCAWPDASSRPSIPLTYSQETQNGYEYAAAGHMIQRGLIKEGMSVVKAVRERYNGEKRNPYNEFECGSNYARSMASYALLNAFSGFEFDMASGLIGFNPVLWKTRDKFRCFFSLASGWGEVQIQKTSTELRMLYGKLFLGRINLPFLTKRTVKKVLLGKTEVGFKQINGEILLKRKLTISTNRPLIILT